MSLPYRGRIAPSPTGFLHLGHAATFWIALERARLAGGSLLLRNDDLDSSRCRAEFVEAMIEDLKWFGIDWREGPDIGGPVGPYNQSERHETYVQGWRELRRKGIIYPCTCSRREVLAAAGAPHAGEEEPIYPGTCRPAREETEGLSRTPEYVFDQSGEKANWRFRVPDGERISFVDGCEGPRTYEAGKDFGDFVVWRKDETPSYQLATVLDDNAMGVTEVVRGADLLLSTARQILLYRALDLPIPAFFHCPLVTDDAGNRLAKRHEALSLQALRQSGASPEELRKKCPCAPG